MPGETIHSYCMRFTQLINDMHTIGMTMKPLQVNTKFVNHLQPEWSKFVTDVKLAKDMHTTNFDHLYAHLIQHVAHANEVRLSRQRYPDQIALVANSPTCLNPTQYYPHLSSITQQSHLPPAPQRTKQPFKMEESPYKQFKGDKYQGMLTQGHERMLQIRECTKPKRPKNSAWFKYKMLMTEALELRAYLDPEQLAFLAYNGDTVIPAQASQEIPTPAAFQNLDAFDSDCDDAPSAKAVLMANLSSYNSDVLSEKKELSLDNDHLLEHIICQDVMNNVMHVNDHSDNVLPANNNSLEHDNSALELLKHENDRLMELLISQDLVHTAVNSLATINDYKSMKQSFFDEYKENFKLHIELDKKNDMIEKAIYNELSKRCSLLENRYLPPLSPCIKNNMAAHVNYLKHTQENADVLREIVEHARGLRPLDSDLASSCKFVTRIQEFLIYISATCPRVSSSTEASGSKPRSNTMKDKIMQTSISNKKTNKVEDQPRIAKSSLNNLNHVSKTVCNANVKHSVLNVNSELICATCYECMFDAIHDLCVHDYLVDVNARVKF
ncbi:hypothetical protein Tco_0011200 [Tanacetum coccineum]